MDDVQIIELYWARDEDAIVQTQQKYGTFCQRIAQNILSVEEDAEECVNDMYYQAWNAIPPQRPVHLQAWLGRVVRNLALNLWNKNHTQKRYGGMTELFQELEECIPHPKTIEHELEEQELSSCLDAWLRSLRREDRVLFVRRYWFGTALNELAGECGVTPGKLAQRMYRLRKSLKNRLEKEGVRL